MAAKRGLTQVIRLDPPELPRLVVGRGLMTEEALADCRRARREIFERFGLTYTLGQVVFERLLVVRPDLRGTILSSGGIASLLGRDVPIEMLKFSPEAHDRFVDRVQKSGLISDAAWQECFTIQYELSRFGILKHLGELLVEKGHADRGLALEYLRPPADPERLPCLAFDRIAVANGLLGEGAAAAARAKQDRIRAETGLDVPIGRILYETGQLRRIEVEAILESQVRIGRLAVAEADLRILKLSRIEDQAMSARLAREGVSTEDQSIAVRTAATLAGFGLDLAPIEVLWLQGKLPERLLRDVVLHQAEHLARLEPRRPSIQLSLAPSAPLLLQQRPPEVPDEDFLFGQCARIAGAVDRDELEHATWIFRRCREELDFPLTLGQILFDLHERDPARFDRLRAALADLRSILDRPYEVRSLRLSPLEYEVVAERLAAAGPALEAAIREANAVVARLSELGLEKDVTEVLLHRGLLAGAAIGDLLVEREARDRRLLGGWRVAGDEATRATRLFDLAFSHDGAATGWSAGLFGNLAIAEGFVDPPQVVRALYVQLRAREAGFVKPLGEILVELGHLTTAQVQSLLRLQERRAEEVHLPRGALAEVEFPENLSGEDRVLYDRLEAGGALDEVRLREHLRGRAVLRSLGLAGSLREVVLAREEVDPELVAGILREADRQGREGDPGAHPESRPEGGSPDERRIREAYANALVQARSVPVAESTISPRVLRAAGGPRRSLAGRALLVAGLASVVAIVAATRSPDRPVVEVDRAAASPRPTSPASAVVEGAPVPPGPPAGEPGPADPVAWSIEEAVRSVEPDGEGAVVVGTLVVPGDPNSVYVVLAGRIAIPPGEQVRVAFAVPGEVLQRSRRTVRDEGRIDAWFGPYRIDPTPSGPSGGSPWLPAGRYLLEVRRGDEPALATAELAFPDPSTADQVRARQEEGIRRFLAVVRAQSSELALALEGLIARLASGRIDRSTAPSSVAALLAAASAARAPLDELRGASVVFPCQRLFEMLIEFHGALERLAGELLTELDEPATLASRLGRSLDGLRALDESLRLQLPAGG